MWEDEEISVNKTQAMASFSTVLYAWPPLGAT